MLKVTLLSGAIFLNFLLFNGCNGPAARNREEIRYENKLDSIYERKIDSAYSRISRACDSTLAGRWKVIEDSILLAHHLADSLERHVADSAAHVQDSLVHIREVVAKHTRDSLRQADHRTHRHKR